MQKPSAIHSGITFQCEISGENWIKRRTLTLTLWVTLLMVRLSLAGWLAASCCVCMYHKFWCKLLSAVSWFPVGQIILLHYCAINSNSLGGWWLVLQVVLALCHQMHFPFERWAVVRGVTNMYDAHKPRLFITVTCKGHGARCTLCTVSGGRGGQPRGSGLRYENQNEY